LFFGQGYEINLEYPSLPGPGACRTLISCFVNQIDVGLLGGGGNGVIQILSATETVGAVYLRVLFDIMYYFLVIILLLNIIFGLILDSFAALRDEEFAKAENILNYCFICSQSREILEKIPGGFDFHQAHEHSTENYVHFIIYLNRKNPLDFTGPEQFVYQQARKMKISFFPLGQSMSLQEIGLSEKEDLDLIRQDVETVKTKMHKLDDIMKLLTKLDKEIRERKNAANVRGSVLMD